MTRFEEACRDGDFKTVEILINGDRHNEGIRAYDYPQALINAIENGHTKIVDFLEDTGLVNKEVMIEASKQGKIETVKYLIEHGVDVNSVGKYDNTAIGWASLKGDLEIVKYLVEQGADVNDGIVDACGKLEIVKYLIEQGADVNATDSFGVSLIKRVSSGNDLELVKYLHQNGADINHADTFNNTAISYAAENGQIEVMKYLVEQGADARFNDDQPLKRALSKDKLESVKFLVENGANLDKALEGFDYFTETYRNKEYLELKAKYISLKPEIEKELLNKVLKEVKQEQQKPVETKKATMRI